jgi:hypothetical protein
MIYTSGKQTYEKLSGSLIIREMPIKTTMKLGVLVHICNCSYSGGRDRRMVVWSHQHREQGELSRHCLKNKPDLAVISVMWEEEVGRLQSKAGLGKSSKPWVQSPVPPKTHKQADKNPQWEITSHPLGCLTSAGDDAEKIEPCTMLVQNCAAVLE